MKIAQDTAVNFHYTLTNDKGDVLDSSSGREPLSYLHGHGNIVPGLESAMQGRTIGDIFDVKVAPADGYGEHMKELVIDVPREAFGEVPGEIQVGMQFQAQTPQGPHMFVVTAVGADTITVDGNHSLAGVGLNFHIEVTSVRAASEEELTHGHVHGAGCCH